jgi:hypothetical protein
MSNEKDTIEPEDQNLSNTNPGEDFDTLNNEGVIDQAHKKINIVGDKRKLYEDIPAAGESPQTINIDQQFDVNGGGGQIPPNNGNHPQPGSGNQQQNTQSGSSQPEEKFNQEFHELPKNEKEENALLAADAIIHAYSNLKMGVPSLLSISEKKLNKMQNKGEINLFQPVKLSRTSPATITVKQLVDQFNATVESPFVTSPEFKENVRPLLAHVLQEEGIALTPKQLLIYYFAQDAAMTLKNGFAAAADRSELINQLKESNKAYASQPVTPVQPTVVTPTPNADQSDKSEPPKAGQEKSPTDIIGEVISRSKDKSPVSRSPLKPKRKYTKKVKPTIS